MEYGFLSLLPVIIAVALSLITRNVVFSLAVACITGCFISGGGLFAFPELLIRSLATEDFIWISACILMFGALMNFFKRSGSIDGFTTWFSKLNLKRRGVQLSAWFLGLFCFEDSMTPFFVGSVMKNIAKKARVSSEKLSYIVDTTSSPVSVIVPISTWPQYLAGLAIGYGCLENHQQAFSMIMKSIPFNFYSIICVISVPLLALGILPEFGPMKSAEERVQRDGSFCREGASPLSNDTEDAGSGLKPRVFLNFILPMLVLVIIAVGTYIFMDDLKIFEAIVIVLVLLSVSLLFQGVKFSRLNDFFLEGVKETLPAVMVLAVAYPLGTVTGELGTAEYVVDVCSGFLRPEVLPAGIFLISAILSFATGTSWGTYAIMLPIALPFAFSLSGGDVTPLVLSTVAAVSGGGVFGDHCSPISDTTVLSSMGAGADHIDHVKSQLPYALLAAGLALVIYLVTGFFL